MRINQDFPPIFFVSDRKSPVGDIGNMVYYRQDSRIDPILSAHSSVQLWEPQDQSLITNRGSRGLQQIEEERNSGLLTQSIQIHQGLEECKDLHSHPERSLATL
jgi:hypothetical protein